MQNRKSAIISALPLIYVYALFFMWGFAWNLFNVLAAFFQETFFLSNTATSLIVVVIPLLLTSLYGFLFPFLPKRAALKSGNR